jgi:hypothetical protein
MNKKISKFKMLNMKGSIGVMFWGCPDSSGEYANLALLTHKTILFTGLQPSYHFGTVYFGTVYFSRLLSAYKLVEFNDNWS